MHLNPPQIPKYQKKALCLGTTSPRMPLKHILLQAMPFPTLSRLLLPLSASQPSAQVHSPVPHSLPRCQIMPFSPCPFAIGQFFFFLGLPLVQLSAAFAAIDCSPTNAKRYCDIQGISGKRKTSKTATIPAVSAGIVDSYVRCVFLHLRVSFFQSRSLSSFTQAST